MERLIRPDVRMFALLAALVLLAAGCGARLSPEQRAAGLTSARGGAAGIGGADGEFGEDGFTDAGGESEQDGGTTAGGSVGSGGTGSSGGGGQGGGGATVNRAQLKATDKGVTPEKIVVANIADNQGVQPGLFKSVQDAAKAATAYINSQGGILGRRIDLLTLDSRTDAGQNRAMVTKACNEAFAIVGAVSAFDDGGASVGAQCGIPDMSAVTTNAPRYNAKNVYPVFPNGGAIGLGSASYIKQRFPNAITNAGLIYLNQDVTRNNALARKQAWESIGYKFIYEDTAQVVEPNYTRFVLQMRDAGVQYLTMVSDYQSIVNLQKAMRSQQWYPEVRDWDSVAYDPGYLELGQEAVEGSYVFLNSAVFEERAAIAEMQLYERWLRRTVPGAKVTYFGLYAWSAFKLFQKLATEIGPDLTRAKLLDKLKATGAWDGNGLHVPHKIGAKEPSSCFLYVEIKSKAFKRMHPGSNFSCGAPLYQPK